MVNTPEAKIKRLLIYIPIFIIPIIPIFLIQNNEAPDYLLMEI